MTAPIPGNASADDLPPGTVPDSFPVVARGFATEEEARTLAVAVGECIRVLSRRYDLRTLDGVTIAHDYAEALLELDRGYATAHLLTPSEGAANGIAMTPAVLRGESLKSHIVLHAGAVAGILDSAHPNFQLALHVIAHECSHVEITSRFEEAFPGMLLRSTHDDVKAALRWEVILACWDEYAATRLSAGIGEDQSDGYETTLLNSMQSARAEANDAIEAYRLHGNVDRLVADVYMVYGTLLKFAAYYLGNLDGLGVPLESRPTLALLLRNHWFAPFFAALQSGCHRIAEAYGSWEDRTDFEALGTLCEEVVAAGGVHWRVLPTGELWVDVPET